MDRSVFSQRLKQLRSLQGISQYALADALGVSRTSLKNWESAVATPPLEVLVDMALYFRVTSDYLLGLEERKSLQISSLSDRYIDALTNLVRVMEGEKSQYADNKKEAIVSATTVMNLDNEIAGLQVR